VKRVRFSMMVFLACLLGFVVFSRDVQAQRAAGDDANIDPMFLIDMPVAGILPATSGSVDALLSPDGGLMMRATYGLITNLNVGLSFGGTRLIGSGGITWNNLPGVMLRYRVLEEDAVYPAVIVGFDTQGQDGWLPSWKQYVVKSPGVFLAVSKNYTLAGSISFHGGLNYTLERHDEDFEPNVFVGAEKTIGPLVSALAEYNFAFDNDKDRKGFWNGGLGLGVRVSTHIGFNVDVLFKNLLTAGFYHQHVVRELRIQYVRYL
jgi:hypothetical protein